MKKFLLTIFFVLCLVSSANAAWVQSYSPGGCCGSPITSLQFTVPNVGAGNLLVLAVRLSTTGTTTVTSPGVTWTKDAHVNQGFVGNTHDVWSTPNVPGGNLSTTVSITGGGTSIRVIVDEYSGMALTNPAHVVDTDDGDSGPSAVINAGPVTTTVANTMLYMSGASDGVPGGPWTSSAGFINHGVCDNSEPRQKLCSQDRQSVAVGTYSGSFTMNGADSWTGILVAYKFSGGIPDTTPPSAPSNLRIIP